MMSVKRMSNEYYYGYFKAYFYYVGYLFVPSKLQTSPLG